MATSPIPTTTQAATLRAIHEHPTSIQGSKVTHGGPRRITRTSLTTIAQRGWINLPENDGPITLTGPWVMGLVTDREGLDAWRSGAPTEHRIYVEKRSRGRATIKALGAVPTGRNVTCSACYRAKQEDAAKRRAEGQVAHYADPVVWYTNEANAQRDAEIVAGDHYLAHVRGDIQPQFT